MALKPETEPIPKTEIPAAYIGDVGYVTWEELNVCDGPGQNFGWPIYEGHHLEPGYAPVLTENPSAPNPLGSNCGIDYFRYQDLLVQDNANTPYWGNPCDSGGFLEMSLLKTATSMLLTFSLASEFSASRRHFHLCLQRCKVVRAVHFRETQTRLKQDFPVVGGKSYVASVKAGTPVGLDFRT